MSHNKTYEGRRKTQVGLYLNEDELELFDDIRWREKRSRADLAHIAVEEYIKSHAEGNDTFKLTKWNEDPEFQAVPSFFTDRDKWRKYYQDSNEKERTKLRIVANDLERIFSNVEFNDNRK